MQEAVEFLYLCLEKELPDAKWAFSVLEPFSLIDEIIFTCAKTKNELRNP